MAIDPARRAFEMANRARRSDVCSIRCSQLSTRFFSRSGDPLDRGRTRSRAWSWRSCRRVRLLPDRFLRQLALVRTLRGMTAKFGSLRRRTVRRSALRGARDGSTRLAHSWNVAIGSESFRRAFLPAITRRRSRLRTRWQTLVRTSAAVVFCWRRRNITSMPRCRAPLAAMPTGPDPYARASRSAWTLTNNSFGHGRRTARKTSRIVPRLSALRLPASRDARSRPWTCTSAPSRRRAQTALSTTRRSPTSWLPAFTRRVASRRSHISTWETRGGAIFDGAPTERCGNSISSIRG